MTSTANSMRRHAGLAVCLALTVSIGAIAGCAGDPPVTTTTKTVTTDTTAPVVPQQQTTTTERTMTTNP
jgi:type IV pilus biogenesis protein CpaD/CtpE